MSGRKPLAAFCSAGPYNRSASTGAHSFTEAMGPFTLQIAWLKSALAHFLLPRLYNPWLPHGVYSVFPARTVTYYIVFQTLTRDMAFPGVTPERTVQSQITKRK